MPAPTRPTVRPRNSPTRSCNPPPTAQPCPARQARSSPGRLRSAASISSTAVSATAAVLVPGMLATAMPRARAAARSIVLTPTPIFWIKRSLRALDDRRRHRLQDVEQHLGVGQQGREAAVILLGTGRDLEALARQ